MGFLISIFLLSFGPNANAGCEAVNAASATSLPPELVEKLQRFEALYQKGLEARAAGKPNPFNELLENPEFQKYLRRINSGYARPMSIRDSATIDDLTQDTLIALHERLASGPLDTELIRWCRNQARANVTKVAREKLGTTQFLVDDEGASYNYEDKSTAPAEPRAEESELELIRKAKSTILNPHHRTILAADPDSTPKRLGSLLHVHESKVPALVAEAHAELAKRVESLRKGVLPILHRREILEIVLSSIKTNSPLSLDGLHPELRLAVIQVQHQVLLGIKTFEKDYPKLARQKETLERKLAEPEKTIAEVARLHDETQQSFLKTFDRAIDNLREKINTRWSNPISGQVTEFLTSVFGHHYNPAPGYWQNYRSVALEGIAKIKDAKTRRILELRMDPELTNQDRAIIAECDPTTYQQRLAEALPALQKETNKLRVSLDDPRTERERFRDALLRQNWGGEFVIDTASLNKRSLATYQAAQAEIVGKFEKITTREGREAMELRVIHNLSNRVASLRLGIDPYTYEKLLQLATKEMEQK